MKFKWRILSENLGEVYVVRHSIFNTCSKIDNLMERARVLWESCYVLIYFCYTASIAIHLS